MTPWRIGLLAVALSTLVLVVPVGLASATPELGHGNGISAVFTTTNAPSGNQVVVFDRSPSGALTWVGNFSTGGMGSGASLADQGSLAVSSDQRWLLAVDAGSNQVSVFSIGERHGTVTLQLTAVSGSGGVAPVSLAIFGPIVYVLNVGNATVAGDIAGFFLTPFGSLLPIPGSTEPLSSRSPTGAAEIAYDPVPGALVVTEKGTSLIDVYPLAFGARALPPTTYPSQGAVPYGFAATPTGAILVSEAGPGSLSSYRIGWNGALDVVSSSVPDFQAAPCWVVVGDQGRVAYTTNADSNSISSYSVSGYGALALETEVAASTDATPTDLAIASDGASLYVRDAGAGEIQGFAVGPSGSLTWTGTVSGLPSYAEGLVAL